MRRMSHGAVHVARMAARVRAMVRRLSISMALSAALLSAACGGPTRRPTPPGPPPAAADPEGPHREAVAAAVKPYLDAELISGVAIGLLDAGRREIYGFGKGPGGAAPDGGSLYEIGSITKVYTGLLLADALQRREVELDAPVADYLPPGVSVPTRDKTAITLRHLALHGAGLPPLPPSIAAAPPANPFGAYDEDALYRDLGQTQLAFTPGTRIQYSNYGAGLLGFAIGRKLGLGYRKAVETRILAPLELRDTYFTVPAAAAPRRVVGTDDELAPVPYWTWDALAASGGLVSTVRDQLKLLEAELDAAAGGKTMPLRNQLRLTQEPQLEASSAENAGLGWMIDAEGRYWHTGGTAGFRAFAGFDPKTKRGVVVLASTSSTLVDRLGRGLFALLAGAPKPWTAPTAAQLATYAGAYDFAGTRLSIVAAGRRLYLEAENEPRVRLAPVSEHEFWIEPLQAVAIFQKEGDKVARLVFGVGGRQVVAPRVE